MTTPYSELMKKQLESNRQSVDDLSKAQYIIGQFWNIQDEVEKLGALVRYGNSYVDITQPYGSDKKKVDFKALKILLDEAFFSNERLKIDVEHLNTSAFMYIRITDKHTGGRYSIDINLNHMQCKKTVIKKTPRVIYDEEVKWECE